MLSMGVNSKYGTSNATVSLLLSSVTRTKRGLRGLEPGLGREASLGDSVFCSLLSRSHHSSCPDKLSPEYSQRLIYAAEKG